MSFNKLDSLYDDLQNIINDSQSDVTKFVEGNNSAGTRVRKAMQAVKSLAQEVRIEVQDQKNAQFQNILKLIKGTTKVAPFFFIYIITYLGFDGEPPFFLPYGSGSLVDLVGLSLPGIFLYFI